MTENDRTFLKAEIAQLNNNDRQKLYKRAAQLRKTLQKPTMRPAVGLLPDDDEDYANVKVRARSSSLDELVVKLLRDDAEQTHFEAEPSEYATILSVYKSRVDVWLHGEVFEARLTPELIQKQQTEIAVGDHVVIEEREGIQFLTRVLRRKTKLSRPDPGIAARERVVVANVDTVVITVSVSAPPLHPRIIDRYLIAIQKGGAKPVIVLNKADLLEGEGDLELLRPYRDQDIPVLAVSAEDGTGIEALRGHLLGGTSAFVGHSGVGKSSLVRALLPSIEIEIGDVSAGNRRGSHTTRRSTLYPLDDNSRVIDTPGVREFGLWKIDQDELAWHFPEFEGCECRFRDCTHTHEPGCGVLVAVEDGRVSPHRYDTFIRLRESM